MSEPTKKGWGKTVLGWFVVQDGEQKPSTDESTDALIAKYAAEEPPPPPPPEVKLQGELPKVAPGQAIDFPAVYVAAGVDAEEQGRVEKATNLLSTLPAATPKDVKRQIVEASLKAFGYPVEAIIEAGVQEIQALEIYIQSGQKQTQDLLSQSQARLEQLNQEIADIKRIMEEQVSAQYQLTQKCNEEKLKIQDVLEFFGQEAVAKVVQQSNKLHDPTTAPSSSADKK